MDRVTRPAQGTGLPTSTETEPAPPGGTAIASGTAQEPRVLPPTSTGPSGAPPLTAVASQDAEPPRVAQQAEADIDPSEKARLLSLLDAAAAKVDRDMHWPGQVRALLARYGTQAFSRGAAQTLLSTPYGPSRATIGGQLPRLANRGILDRVCTGWYRVNPDGMRSHLDKMLALWSPVAPTTPPRALAEPAPQPLPMPRAEIEYRLESAARFATQGRVRPYQPQSQSGLSQSSISVEQGPAPARRPGLPASETGPVLARRSSSGSLGDAPSGPPHGMPCGGLSSPLSGHDERRSAFQPPQPKSAFRPPERVARSVAGTKVAQPPNMVSRLRQLLLPGEDLPPASSAAGRTLILLAARHGRDVSVLDVQDTLNRGGVHHDLAHVHAVLAGLMRRMLPGAIDRVGDMHYRLRLPA